MMPAPERSISLILAMDDDRLIGAGGKLPWHLPGDLKRFKALTLGKTILMGRKTWDSLGRPLPGRDNWVLSRDPRFAPAGARVFAGLDDALAAHARGELMIIGGQQLFAEALPLAQRIYLTRVHARLPGDTWFPQFDARDWREAAGEAHPADERHAHAYRFVTLERV